MAAKPRRSERGGKTAELIADVCDHMQDLRRYYFDVISADENEVTLRISRPSPRPAGFRPRER